MRLPYVLHLQVLPVLLLEVGGARSRQRCVLQLQGRLDVVLLLQGYLLLLWTVPLLLNALNGQAQI
jgi:hypothetical protein